MVNSERGMRITPKGFTIEYRYTSQECDLPFGRQAQGMIKRITNAGQIKNGGGLLRLACKIKNEQTK